MAFPSIRSATITSDATTTTSHTINLPATIRAGDTIWVFVSSTVAGAIGWPDATWNELIDASPHAADDQIGGAWRKADGTEGATIVVTAGSGKMCALAISVQDAADPNIRPPQLSTVATGSATEPNATTCTPTGGAKDYLWYTFFAMEGEQTGITAYPANYTLNQSGLANTGTAGAVATNCTAAGAGRQLNAASEDAGVWDVTGTLDDWAAYTIAFHPAEAITAPLDRVSRNSHPTNFSPRLPASVAVLSIAVNLLQSTLAPIEPMGSNQYDWPLPLRIPSQLLVDISSRPQEDFSIAFIPVDWRNPDLVKRPIRDWQYTTLPNLAPPEQPPLNVVDYPNPLIKGRIRQDWSQNRPQFAVDNSPFNEFNWPNPLLKGQQNKGFINTRTDLYPFNQYNWPVPPPVKRGGQDWIEFKQLDNPVDFPFIPVDYPNPLLKGQQNKGSVHSRPQYYVDLNPNNQFNWPNPQLKKAPGHTWIVNLSESTLAPVAAAPLIPVVWINPNKKGAIITDTSSVIQVETGAAPPTLVNLPNPLPKKEFSQRGFTKSQNLTSVVGNPFTAIIYPNPLLKKKPVLDNILASRNIPETAAGNPFFQRDWPFSLRKKRFVQDHRFYYVIDENAPFTTQSTVNPLRKRLIAHTWTQSPLVSSPISSLPQGKQFHQVPVLKIKSAITWLNPSLSVVQLPQIRIDWPNPLRKEIPITDWLQARPQFYEDIVPFNQLNYPNPIIKVRAALTHIFIPQLFDVDIQRNLIYPNPLLKGKIGETHLINLLGSTLFPGEGEAPVGHNEYPNPPLAKRLRRDWLQWYAIDTSSPDQPFRQIEWNNPIRARRINIDWKYFSSITESLRGVTSANLPLIKKRGILDWIHNSQQNTLGPLPVTSISQKDWPNPLRKKRDISHLTFISDYARFTQGTLPFRFTEWPIPLKRKIAGSWTYNPIITALIPPGLKPFAQTEWPLVVRVRRGGQDYIQRAYILPIVGGRIICLLSDITEYQLESQLEPYDLESRFEIYELESGGDECQ